MIRGVILVSFLLVCLNVSRAQSIELKLQSYARLTGADMTEMAAFDTLADALNMGSASVDTVVVLSDSVLYAIIGVGDFYGTNSLYYLMSFDRVHDRPIALVYLHDSPDIEQSEKQYRWVEHAIWRTDEVGTIEYDCRVHHPNALDERTTMQATGRRFWKVGADGAITGGELVQEE